jgi:nucleotide-binding universal stress UspA family protein
MTIASFAEEMHCDQILIGSRGHGGIVGSLLGSVATKLANLSKIPLLIIR